MTDGPNRVRQSGGSYKVGFANRLAATWRTHGPPSRYAPAATIDGRGMTPKLIGRAPCSSGEVAGSIPAGVCVHLRPYQIEAKDAVRKAHASGQRSAVLVLATGLGKTVVFVSYAEEMLNHGKILVLAHRDELIRQACQKFKHITGKEPVVEKGHQRAVDQENFYNDGRVVVSSIQTQSANGLRRAKLFNPMDFSLLVIDEHHHCMSATYKAVIEYYLGGNPKMSLLGVTATPDRLDGLNLHGHLVYQYDIQHAVGDGYLVPIQSRIVRVNGLDFSKIKKSCGELNQAQLDELMKSEGPLHAVACGTIEAAYGLAKNSLALVNGEAELPLLMGKPRKSLVFCVTVAHAKLLADIINRWIPDSARSIDADTDPDARQAIIQDFKDGKYWCLCNCMIATEGFDVPSIENVVMARPTCSRALAVQMIGRGTRPSETIADAISDMPTAPERVAAIKDSVKPHCLVVDFAGNTGKHKLVQVADIFCDPDAIQLVKDEAEGGDVDVMEAAARAKATIELAEAFEKAAKANAGLWREDGAITLGTQHDEDRENRDAMEDIERDKRKHIRGVANLDYEDRDLLGRHERREDKPLRFSLPEEMIQRLRKMGCKDEFIATVKSSKQAWVILNKMRKVSCSAPQKYMLKKMGVPELEIASLNFDAATERINQLKGVGV